MLKGRKRLPCEEGQLHISRFALPPPRPPGLPSNRPGFATVWQRVWTPTLTSRHRDCAWQLRQSDSAKTLQSLSTVLRALSTPSIGMRDPKGRLFCKIKIGMSLLQGHGLRSRRFLLPRTMRCALSSNKNAESRPQRVHPSHSREEALHRAAHSPRRSHGT